MTDLQIRIIIIQAQIKGLYTELKELASLKCPDCGNETTIAATVYFGRPGMRVVKDEERSKHGMIYVDWLKCLTCNGTGQMGQISENDILDLNRLVGFNRI